MVRINISNDSYSLIRYFLASSLDSEMLDGRVLEWDDINCLRLKALIELDLCCSMGS